MKKNAIVLTEEEVEDEEKQEEEEERQGEWEEVNDGLTKLAIASRNALQGRTAGTITHCPENVKRAITQAAIALIGADFGIGDANSSRHTWHTKWSYWQHNRGSRKIFHLQCQN